MDQTKNDVIDQDIEFLHQQELQRVAASEELFVKNGNPKPERRVVVVMDVVSIFGLEVILRIASTIGAALVSATAVGAVMEITMIKLITAFSAQTDANLTKGIFYWSILAFEVGLMASGMTAGRKNEGMNDSRWAMYAGFGVTITAGLLRSLTLLNDPGVEFVLSLLFGLIVGVAGPLISYYGAENFGYILKEIQHLQDEFDKTWHMALEDWGRRFRAEYPRMAKQIFGEDRRLRPKYEDDEQPQPKGDQESPKRNVREMVRQYLRAQSILPSQVGEPEKGGLITPIHIANELNLIGKERDAVRAYLSQFRADEKRGKW